MRETGIVISAEDNKVRVQISRGDKCDGCHACDATGANAMQVEASNDIGARIGETVDVEVSPGQVFGYSFILFIFPIIMMIVGYFIGMRFSANVDNPGEGTGILGAFLGLGLSLAMIKLYDTFWARKKGSIARVVRRASLPRQELFITPPN